MRLPDGPDSAFSLEVDNPEAWQRLKTVDLLFDGVKVVKISSALHIVNGRPCRWVVTNISDDPKLLNRVEQWVKNRTL